MALEISGIALASAQDDEGTWSTPVLLHEGEELLFEPSVVADLAGGVHVFWATHKDEETGTVPASEAIYYISWDGIKWTDPVDIVFSTGANSPRAAVDPNGQLHLLWHGPLHQLYYSNATAGNAQSAQRWTHPQIIDASNLRADLVADPRGRIHLVYPGSGTSGPYYQYSDDGGKSWSSAQNVWPTSREDSSADFASLALGDDGSLHVAWSEFELPGGWPPLGVFYSRSNDEGQTWSKSVQLAGEGFVQNDIATAPGNEIHVAWNGQVQIGGRYHRWSTDGGETWSEVATLAEDSGGLEGPPQLIVDSNGTLQMLIAYRGCPQHLTWRNQQWSEPVCVATEVPSALGYVEEAAMALGEGNRLHVVFWDNRKRLWYTTTRVLAPHVAPVPWPADVLFTDPVPESSAPLSTTSPSEPTQSALLGAATMESPSRSPGRTLLIGILPAAAVTALALVARALRS